LDERDAPDREPLEREPLDRLRELDAREALERALEREPLAREPLERVRVLLEPERALDAREPPDLDEPERERDPLERDAPERERELEEREPLERELEERDADREELRRGERALERDDERRRRRPPLRSAAGISSVATALVSCGMRRPRKSRMRSSSRRMRRASCAVSRSPTICARCSIAV